MGRGISNIILYIQYRNSTSIDIMVQIYIINIRYMSKFLTAEHCEEEKIDFS